MLVDIKFFANLDGHSWDDPHKYLANAGYGDKEMEYNIQPGEYGTYQDPYLTGKGEVNPHAEKLPDTINLKFPAVSKPVTPTK